MTLRPPTGRRIEEAPAPAHDSNGRAIDNHRHPEDTLPAGPACTVCGHPIYLSPRDGWRHADFTSPLDHYATPYEIPNTARHNRAQ